jgi:diguanylate cyclase (GGDEF)-like protein/PAS domain S-box-containing protein
MRFTFINPRLARMLGRTEKDLLGRRFDSLYPSHDLGSGQTLAERLTRGHATSFEQQLLKADGSLLTAIVADTPDLDAAGRLRGVIVTLTDISERKQSEQRVQYLATHDSLTGLANRPMFLEHLHSSLLIARRHKTRFAVLFLDLDRFKEVNDTLGHAVGDALLVETAQRLRRSLRASDLPARQGGDEFMVLLHDIKTKAEALGVADKIRQAIDRPFTVEGHECRVAVSIGIALYPDDGGDAETLTRQADGAMYRAKTAGRSPSRGPHTGRPAG